MSVVLMLHADEADCFLTCRLSNLCLKINEEHHCNNLPVSLKIKHCNESCESCKAIKDKKCNLARWFYTDGDGYIRCNNGWCEIKLNDTSKPCEYCFCQGCGFEKMIKMKNFTQIVMRTANKTKIVIMERVLQVQKSSKHVNKHKKSQIKHKPK